MKAKKVSRILILIMVLQPFFSLFENDIDHSISNDQLLDFYVQDRLLSSKQITSLDPMDSKVTIEEYNVPPAAYTYEECSLNNEIEPNETVSFQTDEIMNVSLNTCVLNSTFHLNSNGSTNPWQNGLEPSYDDVNISLKSEDDNIYYSLNYTDTGNGGYGISNTKFQQPAIPSPSEEETWIYFDFRIPFMTANLLSSIHTLALEFRFNMSSIFFILSSKGGDFGDIIEDNITQPEGSNSLYVFCNESFPYNWRTVSLNLTRILHSYIPLENHPSFDILTTVFCYMIAFSPDFFLELNLDNILLSSLVGTDIPITYLIEDTSYFTQNGTLATSFEAGTFTITAFENTLWAEMTTTNLEINITRLKLVDCSWYVKESNSTNVTVQMDLIVGDQTTLNEKLFITVPIPIDWDQIEIINSSLTFEKLNQTKAVNEYINAELFFLEITNLDNISFKAICPNYISNVLFSNDISMGENLEVYGDLKYPLEGNIYLSLKNNTFSFYRTTQVMVNGSFVFSNIEITEDFPVGLLNLIINYSNTWEFGLFENYLIIHEKNDDKLEIVLNGDEFIEIFRFQRFFLNISLFSEGLKVNSESMNVILITPNRYYSFEPTARSDYALTIPILDWSAGNYSLDIFAYNKNGLFTTKQVNLTVLNSSFHWEFENLPNFLLVGENLTFRVYTYYSINLNTYQILQGISILLRFGDSTIEFGATSAEGFLDINFDVQDFISSNSLVFSIEGKIVDRTIISRDFSLQVSNNSLLENYDLVYIVENERSSVYVNSSFYIYYQISYPNNGSNWFVNMPTYQDKILSAVIIRDHYIISPSVIQEFICWNLNANQSSKDILILEISGPKAFMKLEIAQSKIKLQIEVFSNNTINNFTLNIDLNNFGLPITNIAIYDSMLREITYFFPITRNNLFITISQLNIINGVKLMFFLEGDIYGIEITENYSFKMEYNYFDSIIGSWRVYCPVNFTYYVYYELENQISQQCYNTTVENDGISSDIYIITAKIPKIGWNLSCKVNLSINPFSDFRVFSENQYFSIVDNEAPMVEYSYRIVDDILSLNTYIFEPEMASGGENLTILLNDNTFTFNIINKQYNVFNLTLEKNKENFITIIAIDRAGNTFRSEEFSVIINWTDNVKLVEYISQSLPAISVSLMIGGVMFIYRKLKKSNSSLL